MNDWIEVYLVEDTVTRKVRVEAQSPSHAAELLGRYLKSEVYVAIDESGVCVALSTLATEARQSAMALNALALRLEAAARNMAEAAAES